MYTDSRQRWFTHIRPWLWMMSFARISPQLNPSDKVLSTSMAIITMGITIAIAIAITITITATTTVSGFGFVGSTLHDSSKVVRLQSLRSALFSISGSINVLLPLIEHIDDFTSKSSDVSRSLLSILINIYALSVSDCPSLLDELRRFQFPSVLSYLLLQCPPNHIDIGVALSLCEFYERLGDDTMTMTDVTMAAHTSELRHGLLLDVILNVNLWTNVSAPVAEMMAEKVCSSAPSQPFAISALPHIVMSTPSPFVCL